MRITSLLALAVLAGGAALASSAPETTIYVDGNLTGVTPHTSGTLLFTDDQAMQFRTLATTVDVPYQGISKAELGATKVHTPDVPMYKVWALHKRFLGKTKTQYLMVHYKNEAGEERNMTLEMSPPSAEEVLSSIESHTGKGKSAKSEWWGDDIWKTTRNADKWNKTATETAP
jgi:hypothetical protein